MEFRAEMRYLRVSPQKARLVLELIKGRRVEEARNTLAFTKKRVAAHVGKLLQSALDNANFLSAEKNLDVEIDNLYVKSAIANDGPRMKRIRPAPQGRAYRYQRRIAHITSDPGGTREDWGFGSATRWGCQDCRGGSGEGQAAGSGSEGGGWQEESGCEVSEQQVPHPRFARVRNDKFYRVRFLGLTEFDLEVSI